MVFNVKLFKGFLNPAQNPEVRALKAGSVVELPAWMAKALGTGGRRYFSPNFPVGYQDIYRWVGSAGLCSGLLKTQAELKE